MEQRGRVGLGEYLPCRMRGLEPERFTARNLHVDVFGSGPHGAGDSWYDPIREGTSPFPRSIENQIHGVSKTDQTPLGRHFMGGRVYRLVRDLHLYLGLFISPFVLVFAVSVPFMAHTWLPKLAADKATTRVVASLILPADLATLSGRRLIDALKPTLEAVQVPGEVGFVRRLVPEQTLIIPVTIPGRETTVTLNLATREATIVTRAAGLAEALVTLHKSPGQHGPDIRMNWVYMKPWRWLADATVYLILFISVSGVYLWYALRAERTVGYILLSAGTLSFFGIAYVLSH